MPNDWMQDILKILDQYYENKIDAEQTVSKINSVAVNYKDEFDIFESQFMDKNKFYKRDK